MADEQIVTNIVATSDFSSLIADVQRTSVALSKLQSQLTLSNTALASQAGQIQKGFGETLRSTGQFTSHFVTVGSEVDRFGKSLDSGRLKLRDYFKVYQDHTKTSSGLIRGLAKEQVALQQSIVQSLGKSADGMQKFNVHVKTGLDEVANKTALAKKEMQIYNKVIQDGGNQIINWGKNTQWAGRQLTVGLTVPIVAFGVAASKAFRDADQELVRLTKVYGGLAATSKEELAQVRRDVAATAKELAAAYGASYKDTISLAADIAATGKQGNELLNSTREATRLSILGEVDRQDAMKATLAIQSAFKQNTDQLTESINFLNAVENQTSTSLADLVEAIPKAGPVVKALGGDVEDLALYLTAMREGGINASEGANALKSALASIINPTKVAREQFMGFGIDLSGIVNKNAGNLTATILEIQAALETLDPLKKSQAIEQLFGKFQFARMNALFENLGKQGSQTLQVLDLMKASSQDLASVAGRELGQITESASGKYRRALESLKAELAKVGEQFLTVQTFFVQLVDKILKFVGNLPDPIKKVLTLLAGFTAAAGPLIMLTGVFANFFGYIIKGVGHLRALFKGGEGFKLLTPQIVAANQAGTLIEKTFYSDAKAATTLAAALSNLNNEFNLLYNKANNVMPVSPAISTMANSIIMPGGDRVVNKQSQYLGKPYSRDMSHMIPSKESQLGSMFGVLPGTSPVNKRISNNPQIYAAGDLPDVPGLTSINNVSTGVVAAQAAKWHSMTAAIAMQSDVDLAALRQEVAATGTITSELSTSYQALLPKMNEVIQKAVKQSELIVMEAKAGKISLEQSKARIVALNAEIEALLASTAQGVAAAQGKVINVGMVPLTSQMAVDPKTGKSNMKEMFHKSSNANLINKIAGVLGVRTSGGGYSTQTTKPRQLNDGGKVFYNNGDQVPGPNVNADVVPAMLTPGEFVIRRDIAQQDPDGMRALNSGQATIVPVQRNMGGMIPGYNRGGYMGSLITNAYMQLFGKNSRSNKQARLVGRWGMIMPQTINDKLAKKLNSKGASGQELIELMQEPARLIDLADFLEFNGVPGDKIDSVLSSTSSLISSRINAEKIYDDNAFGNLALNSVDEQIAALEAEYPGIGLKYQKDRLTPGRRDTEKRRRWLPEKNRNETQKEANARGGGSPTAVNVPGQRKSNYKTGRAKLFAEGNLWGHFYDRKFAANYKAFSKIFRRNAGGPIPGMQYFGSNIPGRIVQSLSKSAIQRLTARWPRPKQFYPPGYQYKLGNQDPLHGPLQIGMSNNLSTYAGANSFERRQEVVFKDDEFNRLNMMPAFLTGTAENRGKYATAQYMSGNLDIMGQMERLGNHPLGPIAAMKSLQKKFTGTLYRGLKLDKTFKALPQDVIDGILLARATGDSSGLIGKDFIMRRSSWTKDSGIASFFGSGAKNDPNSLVIEAKVRNRNILPAGDLFPNKKFQAPYGQDWSGGKPGMQSRSEQEALFGGKFRILGFKDGKLQVETVVDGAREKGGPTQSGRPYLVGENGPEIFVPKTNGIVIPKVRGYSKGDVVKGYSGLRSWVRGKGTLGSSGTANADGTVDPNSTMGTSMAGMGLMMGSQMAPGIAGQGMMFAGMAMQMAPFLPMLTKMTKGLSTFGLVASKIGIVINGLFTAIRIGAAAVMGPIGLITGALTGAVMLFLKLKKDATDAGEVNRATFGLTGTALEEVGIKYKTVGQRIKEVNQQLELNKAKVEASYQTYTKSGVAGLDITLKALNDGIANAKKEDTESVGLFDKAKSGKVNELAASMKAQYVSLGMSVQEATNQIYILIKASNKSSQALAAISSDSFKKISDQSTAAMHSVEMLSNSLSNGDFNAEEFSRGLDNMLNSLVEYRKSLMETNKTQTGLTELESTAKVLEKIAEIGKDQNTIEGDNLAALKQQDMALALILGKSETLASVYAKYELYLRGASSEMNLMAMSAEDATLALQGYQKTIEAAAIALKDTQISIGANKAIKDAKETEEVLKKAQKQDNSYIDAAIKNKEKLIKKLEEERSARLKILELQEKSESFETQIQQAQLRYADAIAAGDMAQAAREQLNIQKLVADKERDNARQSINDKADKERKKYEAEIQKLRDEADRKAKDLAKAQANSDKDQAKSAELSGFNQRINNAAATFGGDISNDVKQFQALLQEMRDKGYGVEVNDLIDKNSNKGNYQTGTNPYETVLRSLQGKTKTELSDKKYDVFDNAVQAFEDAVNKFVENTTTNGPSSSPSPSAGPKKTDLVVSPNNALSLGAVKAAGIKEKNGTYIGQEFTDKYGQKWKITGDRYGQIQVARALNMGGSIKHYNPGGTVSGPGTGTSDSIPAYLSNGEYVIRASAVQQYGKDFFDRANAQKLADGGMPKDLRDLRKMSTGPLGDTNYGSIFSFLSPSESDPSKRSNWSKSVNSFFDKANPIMKHAMGPVIHELIGKNMSKSIANIFAGDSQWNDYTSLASNFVGVGGGAKAAVSGISRASKLKQDFNLMSGATHASYADNLAGKTLDPMAWKTAKMDRLGRLNYLASERMTLGSNPFAPNTYVLSKQSMLKALLGKGLISEKQWAKEFGNGLKPGQTSSKSSEWQRFLNSKYTGISDSTYGKDPLEFGLKFPTKYKQADLNKIQKRSAKLQAKIDKTEVPYSWPIDPKTGLPKSGIKDGGLIQAQKFADGGMASEQGLLSKILFGDNSRNNFFKDPKTGKPAPILKNEIPFGPGSISKASGLMKSLFAIPNKINQIRNQAKVNAMIKNGMWHGSQPLGHRGEDYLQGKNILDGAETYDPFYGMGFFGTSSKSEADLYASGYNSLNNWGESFGSLNQITKAPKGKYIDFTKGTNSLKWQNYELAKALGVKKNEYLGKYMQENLGDIMNSKGMTGAIMNRVNAGRVPADIQNAKWLAWNNPTGVHTIQRAMGGIVGPNYNVPSKTTSVANMPFGRYNQGGMVNNYGGFNIHANPGMDEKMLAKYVMAEIRTENAKSFASQGRPGARLMS